MDTPPLFRWLCLRQKRGLFAARARQRRFAAVLGKGARQFAFAEKIIV
jgi:hypothetical protein